MAAVITDGPRDADDDDWRDFQKAPSHTGHGSGGSRAITHPEYVDSAELSGMSESEREKSTVDQVQMGIHADDATTAIEARSQPLEKVRSAENLPRLEELIEKAIEDVGPTQTSSTPLSESSRASSAESEDSHEMRACAPVLTDFDLEDQEATKMRIYVHSRHGRHAVGWFSDISSPADVRECVLTAIDSIIDDGAKVFKLRSRKSGTIIDLSSDEDLVKLNRGEHYDLLVGERLAGLIHDSADGDRASDSRWRRLRVCIDSMKHVETTKALERMCHGTNLLKHTAHGHPHLRQFQLSTDHQRLLWYSAGPDRKESVMALSDVCELRLGQQTSTFLQYRLPMLQHLSFSLIYKPTHGEVTALDLTCKDEFEYDTWLTGLKALLCAQCNRTISKEQLLAHSRRFREALKQDKAGVKLLELEGVEERGTVGLDDCVKVSESSSPRQLHDKLECLRDRLEHITMELKLLLESEAAEFAHASKRASSTLGIDWAIVAEKEPAYSSLLSDLTDVEDDEMEASRAMELAEGVSDILGRVSTDLLLLEDEADNEALDSHQTGNRVKRLRELDQLLWKAEVDIENVEDMRQRLLEARNRNAGSLFGALPAPLVADMRSSLSVMSAQAEESICDGVEALKGLLGNGRIDERVQLPPGPNH